MYVYIYMYIYTCIYMYIDRYMCICIDGKLRDSIFDQFVGIKPLLLDLFCSGKHLEFGA